MFTEKNKKKLSSLFGFFALAAILLTNSSGIVNAQTPRNRLHNFVDVVSGGVTFANRTDFTTLVFPPTGVTAPIRWKVTGNPGNPAPNQSFRREFDYGIAGPATVQNDSIVVGDYSGDNRSELAVWRDQPTNTGLPGIFYIAQFPIGAGGVTLERAVSFGNGFTDSPVIGDYDGDGKDDYTVLRVVGTQTANNIVYYSLLSSNNTVRATQFGTLVGLTGVNIFPGADFNADGRDEFILVARNAAGTVVTYYIGDSVTGAGVITRSFGNYNTDFSVAPDDYTGDGRADFVAVRQSLGATAVWYIQNSQTGATTGTVFGIADPTFGGDGDSPVRGDFDGDGRHDICVFRDSNATFYYISSASGTSNAQQAGAPGDFPLGSFALY